MRHFINNKPWKKWRTRKISFLISIIGGFIVIFGAAGMILAGCDIDSSTWLSESLDFFKWIVTTGAVIVLAGSTKEIFQIFHNINEDDNEVDE